MVHGTFDIVAHDGRIGRRDDVHTVLVAQVKEIVGQRETVCDDAVDADSLHHDDVLPDPVLRDSDTFGRIEFIVMRELERYAPVVDVQLIVNDFGRPEAESLLLRADDLVLGVKHLEDHVVLDRGAVRPLSYVKGHELCLCSGLLQRIHYANCRLALILDGDERKLVRIIFRACLEHRDPYRVRDHEVGVVLELEVDPYHEVAVRDSRDLAGLSESAELCDFVDICLGHVFKLNMDIGQLEERIHYDHDGSEDTGESVVHRIEDDVTGIVSVIAVNDYNDEVDAFRNELRDEELLTGIDGVGIRCEPVIDIDPEAAADTGSLDVYGSLEIVFGEDDGAPVDTDFVIVSRVGLEDEPVANREFLLVVFVLKALGIVVDKILRQAVTFRLPGRRRIDERPLTVVI